jgi:MinD superfamily P-loop ATPase
MPAYIMDNCIICGTCWDVCPLDAVEEFEDYYRIAERCDDCGKCIRACPNHAIAKTADIGRRLEAKRSHTDLVNDDS